MHAYPLTTADWLSEHLYDPNVRVLDASWYLPSDARDTRKEYKLEHIPGAEFFDIDRIADQQTRLPHMMPSSENFAAAVEKLGIGDENFIVIYDTKGVYSSARVWWAFHAMGHENCAVLDGGLKKWRTKKNPTTASLHEPGQGSFNPTPKLDILRTRYQMLKCIETGSEQVLDARSPSRFEGLEQEPRPDVKPGHIPGSYNIYYSDLVNDDGTMRSVNELRAFFYKSRIDLSRPIVTTCGSGITAAIVFLAAKIAGASQLALYDGSWAEWGSMQDALIETGPGRT